MLQRLRRGRGRLAIGTVISTLLLIVALPGPAGSEPIRAVTDLRQLPIPLGSEGGHVTEHPLPPLSTPCEVELSADEQTVYIELLLPSAIGVLDVPTGDVEVIPTPTPASTPGGMDTGPDGNVWFTEVTGSNLARFDVDTYEITEFPMPTTLATPSDVTLGPDGGLWFNEIGGNKLGRFDVDTHEFEEYPIPTPAAGSLILKPGPGNTIIFTMATANKIGMFDIDTHEFTEWTVPTPASVPWGIHMGPDDAIWFTEYAGNKIGRLDPSTGDITEFSIGTLLHPLPHPGSIIPAADGNLWVVEGTITKGSGVGRFNPETQEYTTFRTPTPFSEPCDFTASADETQLWFGEYTGSNVAVLDVPCPLRAHQQGLPSRRC